MQSLSSMILDVNFDPSAIIFLTYFKFPLLTKTTPELNCISPIDTIEYIAYLVENIDFIYSKKHKR